MRFGYRTGAFISLMESRKKIALGAVLVALALAIGWAWRGGLHTAAYSGPHGAQAAGDGADDAQAASRPRPVARQNPARADFQTAVWLLPLVDGLARRSAAGDAQASYELSLIYEECIGYFDPAQGTVAPAVPREQRSALYRSGAWLATRCEGLGSREDILASFRYRRLAAEQGHLAALIIQLSFAERLQGGERFSPEEQRSLIEVALARGDGQAYLALSMALAYDPGGVGEALAPYPAGNEVAVAAWMMAACDAGVPCGANSALLHDLCGRSFMCSGQSVQAAVVQQLSAAERALARQQADALALRARGLRGQH